MTQKFSQSHFRIQTRSQRHSEGPHPLIELQTVLKLKVGVCTHETLNKVLTDPVSPLGEDPTLDRPDMITCRIRTGQKHDLEV
jgi:hypothetical protein